MSEKMKTMEENALRFKRVIALLLALVIALPMGMVHAEEPEFTEFYKLVTLNPYFKDVPGTIDVTTQGYSGDLMVVTKDLSGSYDSSLTELSIEGGNQTDKRISGHTLQIDQGAVSGTITIRAVIDGEYFFTQTITVKGTAPTPQAHPLTLTVKDANTEEPLQGVTIEVSGTSLNDSTNERGVAVLDVVGTETVKLSKEGYILVTLGASELSGNTLEVRMEKRISGPRVTHTPLDTSDLDNLIVSVKALDDSVQSVQMRTFYKCPYGMVPGGIVSLKQDDLDDAVFKADITYQVKSMMRDYNAYEMTYFFAMSDSDGGFLKYPEDVVEGTLEGALTVQLTEPLDLSHAPIVEHTLPVVTGFNNIPATFTITGLQDGDTPTINVYYRSESSGNYLSVVKQMGQLTHVQGATYTVNLANPEFEQEKAYTIEYFITINQGKDWFYYPNGINPYAVTGLYSISIPQELYGGLEEPELNKTDLITKINEAKDLYSHAVAGNDYGEYPGEAMDAFHTAIETASHTNDTATTQAEIDTAYQNLTGSISAFKATAIKGASYQDLWNKYNDARTLYWDTLPGEGVGQYPQPAKETFMLAIVSVEGVLNNSAPPQEEIDSAYQTISYAIKAYLASEVQAGDPAKLQAKINEAQQLLDSVVVGDSVGQYPAEANDALLAAVTAAWTKLNDTAATEAQLDAAYQALDAAITTFNNAINKAGDTTALQAKIREAWDLIDASYEGNEPGQYPQSAFDDLSNAKMVASIYVSTPFTQAEINQAYDDLVKAIQAFRDAENTGTNKQALYAAVGAAQTFLNNSVEGTKVGQYPAGSINVFADSISTAMDILIDMSSTQQQVDQALANLNNSLTVFKASVLKQGETLSLHVTIMDAKPLLDSPVGEGIGEFPAAAIEALRTAIDAAEAAIHEPMTDAELAAAQHTLETAVTTFKAAEVREGDKLALQGKIADATSAYMMSQVGTEVNQYPAEAKAALKAAIDAAKLVQDKPTASQNEIDAACQTLSAALTTFYNAIVQLGDYHALQAKIQEASSLKWNSTRGDQIGQYPDAAFDEFNEAIGAADEIAMYPASQTKLDKATQALSGAMEKFKASVIQAGDATALKAKIKEAWDLIDASVEGNEPGQYPTSAIRDLNDAMTHAGIWAYDPATQADINQAYDDLVKAIQAFRDAVNTGPNKQPLQTAIGAANAFLNASVEGTKVGQYPAGSKNTLQGIIDTAFATLVDLSATQIQLDQALANLNHSLADFKASVLVQGDPAPLQLKIASTKTLLNNSQVGENVGQYPADAKAALQTAVAAAEAALGEPMTDAELAAAQQALEAAIGAFQATANGDNTQLKTKIDEGTNLFLTCPIGDRPGDYPQAAMNALGEAINTAYFVTMHPASQKVINDAYQALLAAIQTFQDAKIPEADKTALVTALAEAKAFLAASVEGDGIGEYPSGSKELVEIFVEIAEGTVGDSHAPQALVQQSLTQLNSSLASFKSSVNKAGNPTALQAAVANAEALRNQAEPGEDVGQYPAEAIEALEAAIVAAQGVLDKPSTQAELTAAKQALETAVTTFKAAVIKAGDHAALQAAITEAKAFFEGSIKGEAVGEYPAVAVNAFEVAIAAAQETLMSPKTQAQLDAAKAALDAAVATFEAAVNVKGDSGEADAAVMAAEATLDDAVVGEGVGEYPAAAVDALNAAIAAAKEVLKNPATQAQIDAAKATLDAAVATFEAAVILAGDSAKLTDQMDKANGLLQNSVEGDHVGEYPSEAVVAFEKAIHQAEELLDSPRTQKEIDAAYQALAEAIKDFTDAKIQAGDNTALLTAIAEATQLYNNSKEGYGAGQYWPQVRALFMADIQTAQDVAGRPSTQEEIEEALQALEDAKEDFSKSYVPAGDDSDLQEFITNLKSFLTTVVEGIDAGEYPAGSKAVLQAAIAAAAQVISEPATQEQIDQASEKLEDAVEVFVAAKIPAGNNTKALNKIYEVGRLLEDSQVGGGVGQYPAEAKAALKAAFDAAVIVLDKPSSQVKLDATYQSLVDAMDAFKKAQIQAGDSKEADAAVTEAKATLDAAVVGKGVGQYSEAAVDALKAAIEAAKETLKSPKTQDQIDAVKAKLDTAVATFEAAVNVKGDSKDADAAVTAAEATLDAAVVGEGVGQYPEAAVDALKAAIEAAKETLKSPKTQAQIDAAKATLDVAVATFEAAVNVKGDSKDADAAMTAAEATLDAAVVGEGVGQYPAAAVDALKAAIAAAKETLKSPKTQAQIDAAKATLDAAVATFEASVNVKGDSGEANAAVTEAEGLLVDVNEGEDVGQYPAEAVDALRAAIAEAKEALKNPATQAQIDAAKAALDTAVATFEAAVNVKGESGEADAAVTAAEATLDAAVIGEGVDQYPAEAVDVLRAAIAEAKEALKNPATQVQIDAAKATLDAAVATFEASVNVKGDSGEANAAVTEAEGLLVDVPVGEGVGQYPAEAVNALKAAITEAKEALKNPATQAQIDAAKAALDTAVATFEAAVNVKGDSKDADAAVTAAEATLDGVVMGEGVGEYPAEAVDALKAAIAEAKEALKNPATQAQLDAAKAALDAAVATFEAAVNVKGDSEEANAVVTEAETLLVDVPVGEGVGQYPTAAVDVLKAAIAKAKEALKNPATQAQIDAAKATLDAAVATFEAAVNVKGDSGDANAAVTEAEGLLVDVPVGEDVGQYPAEAVDALRAAIAEAKEALKNPATQAQIDAAKATLDAAVATFEAAVNVKGDSEEANAVVTEAETLLVDVPVGEGVGQYPAEAVEALKAAIAAAKEALKNPGTQAQIDAAKATLNAAITAFENAVNVKGDSKEADAAVTAAEATLDGVVMGEGVGQYPAAAVDALKAAIAAAKETLKNPATQAQIDAAKAALDAAVATFKAAVVKAGDAAELQTQITAAKSLLDKSTEGYSAGQYPIGSKAVLQAAITEAEKVIRTAATQNEIDKALAVLTKAYDAFREAVLTTSPVYPNPPQTSTQPVVQPSTKITDGLTTVEVGQGTVKADTTEVQSIMKDGKPIILESALATIDFGKNGLNVPELKQGLKATLELGTLLTEKSKTEEVLAGAKLEQAGLQPLGGKVLDLIAQLNYSNGTSTRIKSFAEPVKVTINLKELGLTGGTTNLTAVRFVPQADGTYKTIKLGGVYIPASNSFEFYTDSFSLYSIVKADSVTKITFKIDSTKYSIGTLAKQTDVPPVVREQRTLVPIRVVAEALGAKVKWNQATQTATITLNGRVLTLTLGKTIEGMDVPAQEMNGRILVPLRYVSEALGAYVMWFPQDQRIEIIR
ncbi:stalk domain-containing protein [Gorillibacterium sp. sgz500922]|uniref:stalk domain-containing protein n=1 Tax=Gorillibacterium sp. sgz500922 TaxID=3446694 RepID=UPI003F67243F